MNFMLNPFMRKMKTQLPIRTGIFFILVSLFAVVNSFAQDVPPLVYDVEFTGIDCTKPPLPIFDELPIVKPLTDPFEWSDGSGRDTTFASWAHRRAEIKAEIENYEVGPKPDRPDTITASYENDTLRVYITVNGNTLTLISPVYLPEGDGPFPAVIGMGSPNGSVPADVFTSRNIARIPFDFPQVMQHTQVRGTEPINKLYPDLTYMGAYSAWPWGVSRLIDGLELVQDSLPIDLKHLAVTGCSFAGKMALFAGAFDERVALTIAQESGGGGAPAWRVSETLPNVEKLGATNHAWFMDAMFQFSGRNVSKLPHDHHELMAMCAPRALLVTGNTDFEWLANPACYVGAKATEQVYNTLGIGDRFGYYVDGGHGHCAIPDLQRPAIEAFVDKYLLGDTTVNTDVGVHPYPEIIPEYWYDWWGKGEPEFALLDRGESEEVWFEAECATVGAAWNVRLDTLASNESYAVPKDGLISTQVSPADSIEASLIFPPFNLTKQTTFYLYGRLNCARNKDTYWIKMDDDPYKIVGGLTTDGWEWKQITSFSLAPGEHNLSIAYRVDQSKIDKICISEFNYPPGKMGEEAETVCEPDTTTQAYTALEIVGGSSSYTLGQNYPNPFNDNTTIAFEIPRDTYVSLKVYSIMGEEVAELAGREYAAGVHTLEFDARNLSRGIYFYTFKADKFTSSRKMILQTE
jgi:hypothetical protein